MILLLLKPAELLNIFDITSRTANLIHIAILQLQIITQFLKPVDLMTMTCNLFVQNNL